MNNTTLGWALAALGGVVGFAAYGWQGLVLALTFIVFWLLLQFSRALRALRAATGRPVGQVDNAVMLHARLQTGMSLPQILRVTRSLGRQMASEPEEAFAWHDAAGDGVQVQMRAGRLVSWSLQRAAESAPTAATGTAASAFSPEAAPGPAPRT